MFCFFPPIAPFFHGISHRGVFFLTLYPVFSGIGADLYLPVVNLILTKQNNHFPSSQHTPLPSSAGHTTKAILFHHLSRGESGGVGLAWVFSAPHRHRRGRCSGRLFVVDALLIPTHSHRAVQRARTHATTHMLGDVKLSFELCAEQEHNRRWRVEKKG